MEGADLVVVVALAVADTMAETTEAARVAVLVATWALAVTEAVGSCIQSLRHRAPSSSVEM